MSDLHERWPHRWLSEKATSHDSGVHGLGVFATADIGKGEVVAVLGGIVVHRDAIDEYWDEMGHVGIQVSDDFFIVPTDREELERTGVFNHSCSPNLGFKDSIHLIAMRDIEEGEELAFDYAFNETIHKPFACNCRSDRCRGKVRPDDWQREDVRRHSKYFSPYLRERLTKANP